MVTTRDVEQLRLRRQRVGLSLRAVSRSAHVHHAYLPERGLTPVSAAQMARIERALVEAAIASVLDRRSLVDIVEALVR
jgi:methylphosphotriester-DNA--protein-cysteine methyltransferase